MDGVIRCAVFSVWWMENFPMLLCIMLPLVWRYIWGAFCCYHTCFTQWESSLSWKSFRCCFKAYKVFAHEIYCSHVRTGRVLILRKHWRKCFELRTEVVGLLTHIACLESIVWGRIYVSIINDTRLDDFSSA